MKWLLTLGAGDDTLSFVIGSALASASATLAGDILAGGAGTDTLSITSAVGNAQTDAYTGCPTLRNYNFKRIAESTTVANYGLV